jgi:hypothetical protein
MGFPAIRNNEFVENARQCWPFGGAINTLCGAENRAQCEEFQASFDLQCSQLIAKALLW